MMGDAARAEADLVGAVLGGRYRVVRLIGAGGMGAVYEAVHEELGRRVALKVVHAHLLAAPGGAELLERFRREAQAAGALGHPNIVQITDFQAKPGERAFLVMELLAGESLAQALDRAAPMSPARAAFIASQTLAALEAAHMAGIVHRDVKPDNVFLTSIAGVGDVVKVLDFGVAKVLAEVDARSRLTATGAMVGTPMYMAPEQARGRDVDARADVYAVAACLYHALAGRAPFEAPTYNALLFSIVEDAPPPLATLRPELDPALVAVVEKGLAKSPDARFQSAAQMRAALAPFGTPSGAPLEPPAERASAPADPLAATAIARVTPEKPTPVRVRTGDAPPPRGRTVRVFVSVAAIAAVGVGAVVLAMRARSEDPVADVAREHADPASAAGSFGPPMSSAIVAASSRPSAAAPAAAAKAPPPAHGLPTGGVHPYLGYSAIGDNYDASAWRARFEAQQGALVGCYVATEYDPVPHEFMEWTFGIDATGRVTSVGPAGGGPRSAALDACVQRAIASFTFGPSRTGKASTVQIEITARTPQNP